MAISPLNRILLVEDDLDIQMVAQLSLSDIGGFDVEVCGSGQQALEAAPRFKPDVILLDVMMPELDGLGTLEALRSNPDSEHTPVIFMTAKAQPKEVSDYLQAGAIDVIVKPFDPVALPKMLREIWSRYGAKEDAELSGSAAAVDR